jgi:hypothetical protein
LSITLFAKNTGTMPWFAPDESNSFGTAAFNPGRVSIQMNLLDAVQWDNPVVTRMQMEQAIQGGQFAVSSTGDADRVRGTLHALRLTGNSNALGGGCVAPGETGKFVVELTAPSGSTTPLPIGLHGLRLVSTALENSVRHSFRVYVVLTSGSSACCFVTF